MNNPWPQLRVSDLCVLAVDCVNKTAPTVDYETTFKMIRTTNVKGGFVDVNNVRHVEEAVFEKWTRRSRPQYGDVILTREAPVGEVGRFTSHDENVFLGQRLFHYRPNSELLDWNFLAYALQSHDIQGRLSGMGFGATVQHIKVGDAENLLIPCPPIQVQRLIGSILSAYDDLIENNWRRMELLEESERLLYREWFVRLRFPGHEHTTIANGIPEGWEKKPLGELVEIKKGKNITKDTVNEGTIPVVAGGLKPAYFHNTSNATGPVVTASASGANAGYVNLYLEDIWASDCSYIEKPSCEFIYFFYLTLDSMQKEIFGMQKGAAQPHVYPKDLMRLQILVPSLSLLQEFESQIKTSYDLIGNLTKQNQKLREARDLLLPRLMSGEIAA